MSTPLNNILVVGAGATAKQIALQCARYGYRVVIYERSSLVLNWVPQEMSKIVDQLVEVGFITAAQRAPLLQHIELTDNLGVAAQKADLIIESVSEDLEEKKATIGECGMYCRPEAICVTNSATFMPSLMVEAAGKPDHFAALHFHMPVAISNVVEIMPHPGTARDVVDALDRFARNIGQIPIRCNREHTGYVFDSLFSAVQREALDLVINRVVSVEDVDRAWMRLFNMPLGPFGMFDQIGLDVVEENFRNLAVQRSDIADQKRATYLRALTSQGHLGIKSNQGFYHYPAPSYSQKEFLSTDGK